MKRILSIVVAVTMILSLLPCAGVSAEEKDNGIAATGDSVSSGDSDPGEAALAEARRLCAEGSASLISAEDWTIGGVQGSNYWANANGSMTQDDLLVTPADVEGQSFGRALNIKTTRKAAGNWEAQVFLKLTGEVKTGDQLFYAFRIKGISNASEGATAVTTNIRIRPSNEDAGEKNIMRNDITGDIEEGWTLIYGTAASPVDSDASTSVDGSGSKYGAFVLQVGMAEEEFQIADFCIINLSRAAEEEETPAGDPGENALANAVKQYEEGLATRITAENWTAVGSQGDNCWVDANNSMTAADVQAKEVAVEGQNFEKALNIKTTKKADGNYHAQIFFKTTGTVKAGDELFYAFRIRGIDNATTPGTVTVNMRIRPSNMGDAACNITRNDITVAMDDGWTLIYGSAPSPVDSADSNSVDGAGNKYGAFVLQVGMAEEEFEIADLVIFNLSRTAGWEDEEEEPVATYTFGEVMQLYKDGMGELVSYPKLSDEGAYELEYQANMNESNFIVEEIGVRNQDFTEALNIRTTETGTNTWSAQVYFNLDKTRKIESGDVLFFGCKVRGISSVTNKEAMFVTANTRIRPDRSTSANFDITSYINADDENDWTQIYGVATAPAASLADTDGAWVFQLGNAIQELQIADVFVINFGKELNKNQLPVMTKSYLGMDEDAQWRKDALERIERIRKEDITVRLVDGNDAPIENAEVRIEQTRHEFGFGTIVNVDSYEKMDASTQEKYREAFEQIAHNRAGFENALKSNYITDEERQVLIEQWMDYFAAQDIDVRGHVLIYGQDSRLNNVPLSGSKTDLDNRDLLISDTEEGRAALREWTRSHIDTYVQKYKGQIYNWDVVNENMTAHDWSDRLGGYDALVEWFQDAHAADPEAKLTYNDYGILSRDSGHQDYHYDLCQYLTDHDAPITTIGIQGHVSLISPIEIISILDRFSTLGKEIEITEFTYEDDDEELQAQFTRDFMIAVFSEEAVTSLTTWGFWEGCMYQPKAAMVDNSFRLKPNGQVWRDLVYDQWWTKEDGVTDPGGSYGTRAFKGEHEVTVRVGDTEQKFALTLGDEPVVLELLYEDGKIEEKSDQKLLEEAVERAEKLLAEYRAASWATNETTSGDILAAVQEEAAAVSAKVQVSWKASTAATRERAEIQGADGIEFQKQYATCTLEGWITGTLLVTCGEERGQIAVDQTIAKLAHTYFGDWNTDGENRWKECSVCGYRITEKIENTQQTSGGGTQGGQPQKEQGTANGNNGETSQKEESKVIKAPVSFRAPVTGDQAAIVAGILVLAMSGIGMILLCLSRKETS